MHTISKKTGGVLLIIGTSIGAGMLALPVANASFGFWPSTFLLIFCWGLMTLGALYMTEASLYVPKGQHLISMARATLGTKGIAVAWLSYVLLLYTLLSAYISGGADVLGGLFKAQGQAIPDWVSITLFTLFFGWFVYQGIRSVDLLNRVLMFGKLAVFLLLILLIFPHTHSAYLTHQTTNIRVDLVMILITSFGFAIIVPNLRDYFEADAATLKQIVWVGSLIPLICYIIWDKIIMGAISSPVLISLQQSDHTTSLLAQYLTQQVQNPVIHFLFNFFTSICMLTAFLGVSLCLMSFLSDAFKLTQCGREGWLLFFLTFLPPWLIVIFYPGAYLHALSYAGSCCVVLLLLLPAWMCLEGRRQFKPSWQVPGGKGLQYLLIFTSLILLGLSFI